MFQRTPRPGLLFFTFPQYQHIYLMKLELHLFMFKLESLEQTGNHVFGSCLFKKGTQLIWEITQDIGRLRNNHQAPVRSLSFVLFFLSEEDSSTGWSEGPAQLAQTEWLVHARGNVKEETGCLEGFGFLLFFESMPTSWRM